MAALLHLPTLMIVLACGAFVHAVVVALMWLRDRSRVMIGLWALGFLLIASGTLLLGLRPVLPDFLSITVGGGLGQLAFGLFWLGFRDFERRPGNVLVALAGFAVWVAVCSIPLPWVALTGRIVAAALGIAFYSLAIAADLLRGDRAEPLPSRLPAAVLFASHAALQLLRVVLSFVWPAAGQAVPPWFSVLALESTVHAMVTAMFLMALIKDRQERIYRLASETDSLTGVANRATFLRTAEERLEATRPAGALLLFDLDHFKAINDGFGHAGGDRALQTFARLACDRIGPDSLFGRVGGEEFACFLPQADMETALALAEDIRHALEETRIVHLGQSMRLTTSIGVATAEMAEGFDPLLATADDALYRAKRAGRNCARAFSPAARLHQMLPPADDRIALVR